VSTVHERVARGSGGPGEQLRERHAWTNGVSVEMVGFGGGRFWHGKFQLAIFPL
jgi:hypothetical protein